VIWLGDALVRLLFGGRTEEGRIPCRISSALRGVGVGSVGSEQRRNRQDLSSTIATVRKHMEHVFDRTGSVTVPPLRRSPKHAWCVIGGKERLAVWSVPGSART
jgi:hypothetical protein